jgi:hypothetical protein
MLKADQQEHPQHRSHFMGPSIFLARLSALAVALVLPVAAIAHHGWAWTEDQESQLTGTLEKIHLGNPHAYVGLRDAQGLWEVDLAPPSATERAGFVEGVAKVGDKAIVTGHRSKDVKELVFKAETITVTGKTYDVYPNRAKTLTPTP